MGLVDDITPASTVFAAFNHYAGPKQIEVYPFNGHDGGGTQHFLAKLAFLASLGEPAGLIRPEPDRRAGLNRDRRTSGGRVR